MPIHRAVVVHRRRRVRRPAVAAAAPYPVFSQQAALDLERIIIENPLYTTASQLKHSSGFAAIF